MKRLIDLLVSAAALILLAPLMAVIGTAVWLESGCPVFFKQRRVGRGFREFHIWKFRTMRPDPLGAPITVAGDHRVTRIGRFLRATKLDELPQFWNVLRGDMSLVGPRPELPDYARRYRDRFERVLSVRPGITDLASVRYRHEEEALAASANPLRAYEEKILPDKLALAEEYVSRHSLWLDAQILAMAFWVVVSRPVPRRTATSILIRDRH